MTCLWGCHWQRMVIIKKNPLLPVYINQPPYLWMQLLWCGVTWLLRNRFERREQKVRRRTASGKTIAIPSMPNLFSGSLSKPLVGKMSKPNSRLLLLEKAVLFNIDSSIIPRFWKSFIEKGGLCFPVRLTVLCREFSFEVSVITWICTSQTFQLWQIVWVIVHCVVIYCLKVCMATGTPVWGRVKHLLLKRMSIGLKFAQQCCE